MNFLLITPTSQGMKAVLKEWGKRVYLWSERAVIWWQYIAVPNACQSPALFHGFLPRSDHDCRAPLHFLGEVLHIEFFWGAVDKLRLYISRSSEKHAGLTCFWFPQYGGGKGTPDDSMDAYRSGLAAKQLNLRSTSLAPQYKSRWRSLGSGGTCT